MVLAVGAWTSYLLAVAQHRAAEARSRDEVLAALSAVGDTISRETFSALSLTEGIAATVAVDGEISRDRFDALSAELLRRDGGVRNIALAPDNVIAYVFPTAGNERAIGLRYAANPAQWPSVARMMQQRSRVVAGPLALVQGGTGLIGRTPIYVRDASSAGGVRYWGLVSTVVDFDRLIDHAAVTSAGRRLRIALRGVDGTGARGPPFWGDASVFADAPVTLDVPLPAGSWQAAAVPLAGWPPFRLSTSPHALIGALLTIVFAGGLHQLLRLAALRSRWIDDQRAVEATLRRSNRALRLFATVERAAAVASDEDAMLGEVGRELGGLGDLSEGITGRFDPASDGGDRTESAAPAAVATAIAVSRSSGAQLLVVHGRDLASEDVAFIGELREAVARGVSVVRDRAEHRRTQEAHREREQQLSTIYDTVADVIFHIAVERGDRFRFVSVNRAFSQVTGVPPEAILGRYVDEVVPPESLDLVVSRYCRARDTGSVVRWEETSDYPAGRLTGEVSVAPVIDAAGQCTYLVGTVHDITERKRAAEALARSEERYRTTLESIMEGCQILDFAWRYTYLNDVAAVHNRRPNAELLGRTMQESWPGIEHTAVYAMLERTMTERVAGHQETEFVFPEGSSSWFDVRVQPVPEGIFVLSIDISERKRAEQALRELNESLGRKVHERTQALETARLRAEAADHLKSAFLATMSHELRTPLNSILGFTGLVLQGLAGPLTDEQAKQLGMVRSSARHLLDLINDVLDISKIEAGQLEIRAAPFDLLASIERVRAMVAPLAEKKGLGLHVAVPELPGAMHSDRRRVEQILLNLLNNGIKFTDHGEIVLAVGVANDSVRFTVADTGIGMRKEHLSELFQPFRQLDSGLQRQHEGTGLGLAICHRLVGLLGGTISVESEWGRGSEFFVTLPMTLGPA